MEKLIGGSFRSADARFVNLCLVAFHLGPNDSALIKQSGTAFLQRR
jgi:hypothetical protein